MEEIEKPITIGEEEIENTERKDQDFGHSENAIKKVEKEKNRWDGRIWNINSTASRV